MDKKTAERAANTIRTLSYRVDELHAENLKLKKEKEELETELERTTEELVWGPNG